MSLSICTAWNAVTAVTLQESDEMCDVMLLVKGARGWDWKGSWGTEAGLEKTRS